MVSFRWKFLLLGLSLGLNPVFGSLAYASIPFTSVSVPITLPALVQGSTRIFEAVVDRVLMTSPEPEMTVTVTLLRVLKGRNVPGSQATFRFAFPLASVISQGDRVLWFLPVDGPGGYTVPLGYTNGDFRVDLNSNAVSRSWNRGLWDSGVELWETGECSRSRFLNILDREGLGGSDILKYLRWADSPYYSQAYPLGFLEAAVLSCLDSVDYRRYEILSPSRPEAY